MQQIDELIIQIQRDINCTIDEDRNIRKQGLVKLNEFFKKTEEIKILVFEKYVVKNLLRAFDDKIEKHRELAYNILQSYLKIPRQTEIQNDLAETIIKTLIARLNQIPYLESSEELRLVLISLISQFLEKNPNQFLPLLSDYTNMLYKALCDQFPDMKKVTSELCIASSNVLKKYIGGYFNNVVKQLATNMTHQHSKVRKITVEALAPVILCEGSGQFLEFALINLKRLTQDKATDVRKSTFLTISKLLQGLSVYNLELFENQLYLILLNGLGDENIEIQKFTLTQLEEVGQKRKQFAQELGNAQ